MDCNTWRYLRFVSLVTSILFYFCFLQSALSCVTVDVFYTVYLENKSELFICFKLLFQVCDVFLDCLHVMGIGTACNLKNK